MHKFTAVLCRPGKFVHFLFVLNVFVNENELQPDSIYCMIISVKLLILYNERFEKQSFAIVY